MEQQYLNALKFVLDNGTVKTDRTGTGTISYFGMQQRYDLSNGFPAVTTKKLAWRSVVSELLWFIEGSGDERRLREILHGDRNSDKETIWTANAEADYWRSRAKFPGDLGRVYGVQWRRWEPPRWGLLVDQLQNLIDNIKRDPNGRRHILTAWNPGELDDMALPPCHVMSQFSVTDGRLSCQMYQRSCDMFLGVPFNIASYSLLTCMIAQVCDLEVGEFIHVLGDAHIYLNHVNQVKLQLSRSPYSAPRLKLNPSIRTITEFKMSDIELIDYQCHGAIQADMAV